MGLPAVLYKAGELCGICVRIWCVDSVCKNALVANDTFMVLDKCNDCKTPGDLVVSTRAIEDMSGVSADLNPSLQIAWEFTSCSPYIVGGIKMTTHENLSPTFVG